MRFLAFLCMLTVLASATTVLAQRHKHQHGFSEKLHEPIPPEYHKITNRLKNWNTIAESELEKLRTSTNPKVVAWREAIGRIDATDEVAFLREVNRISNHAVLYVDDYKHYHKDYWAPPFETLVEGGDCEDIALLKAVALHMRGWKVADRAHILIGMVRMHGRDVAHAVLQIASEDGNENYVLRSLNDTVPTFDEIEGVFKPIYMVSSKNLIVFKEDGKKFAYRMPTGIGTVEAAAGPTSPQDAQD